MPQEGKDLDMKEISWSGVTPFADYNKELGEHGPVWDLKGVKPSHGVGVSLLLPFLLPTIPIFWFEGSIKCSGMPISLVCPSQCAF